MQLTTIFAIGIVMSTPALKRLYCPISKTPCTRTHATAIFGSRKLTDEFMLGRAGVDTALIRRQKLTRASWQEDMCKLLLDRSTFQGQ